MKLNNDTQNFIDMPKLESPFERETIDGKYVCVPKIRDEYRWIFTEECEAVEKLDGTNVSVIIENGKIKAVFNRKNLIGIWTKGGVRFVTGIVEAIDRGYFTPVLLSDGQYFGELIGAKIQGNPYKVEAHLWMPFNRLRTHFTFKFWTNDVIKDVENLDDENIYEHVSDVFKGLWSLYKRKRGINVAVTYIYKTESKVDENTKFEGLASEGIVFCRRGSNEMCKLRRDMFDWFKGRAR